MAALFARERFDRVIHLAAQAACATRSRTRSPTSTATWSGFAEHPRGLPAPRRRAPGLRVHQLGVRREHEDAVLGAPERRPSAVALRGHQEGQRADGAHLRAPLLAAGHGPAVLHGVRSLGPAGHGAVPVHAEHPRGRADRRLQLRQAPARLHLRRRHRRGRGARLRPRGHAATTPGTATRRTPARAARRTGSTTSATTSRSS